MLRLTYYIAVTLLITALPGCSMSELITRTLDRNDRENERASSRTYCGPSGDSYAIKMRRKYEPENRGRSRQEIRAEVLDEINAEGRARRKDDRESLGDSFATTVLEMGIEAVVVPVAVVALSPVAKLIHRSKEKASARTEQEYQELAARGRAYQESLNASETLEASNPTEQAATVVPASATILSE